MRESHQIIFYGAPGTGKSYTIAEQTKGEEVIRTTFHPDSDYSTFVGAYKPTMEIVKVRNSAGNVVKEFRDGEREMKDVTENRIVYEFVAQAFLKAYVNAWKFIFIAENKNNPQKQYLVIEEINRGNCAQIFGDIFQLLDRNEEGFSSYPIEADRDIQKFLQKAFAGITIKDAPDVVKEVLKGEILLLPNNLYIWATMNTSDQSLFPIDSAFKRRWDWQYMPIAQGYNEDGSEKEWKIEVNDTLYSWWSFIEKINEKIWEVTQSEDKKLGFFFCKANNDDKITAKTFVSKVIFYLWNDVFKDYGMEDSVFKGVGAFHEFYKADKKGNGVVLEGKVEEFLEGLGVLIDDPNEEVDEDGNTANSKTKDYTKYAINGNGNYKKTKVVYEAMKIYIANNPHKNAEDIINDWLALGVKKTNFIETQAEYDEKKNKTKDKKLFDKRRIEVKLTNGETFYVSNQYSLYLIEHVRSKINAAGWGITISPVV